MRSTAAQQKQNAIFILQASSNPAAATILQLLEKHELGLKQSQLIQRLYSGEALITEQLGRECDEAYMQLSQLHDVVMRYLNELVGTEYDAARLMLKDLLDRVERAEHQIEAVRRWWIRE